MIIAVPLGVTRRLGKSQGYKGLPIRDMEIDGDNFMLSVWEPTPNEIEQIKNGAEIVLSVMGMNCPLMMLAVGPSPLNKLEQFPKGNLLEMISINASRIVGIWNPNSDEIKIIREGTNVILSVKGTAHPPVMITVNPDHPTNQS